MCNVNVQNYKVHIIIFKNTFKIHNFKNEYDNI